MSNESVGCLTCGSKHLKTTCVDTYLAEVHKGCCWGGADILPILISFCVNENGVKAMKRPAGPFRWAGSYNPSLQHSFICLRLLYGRKYEQLMCFTAAARGGGSPEPRGHVTAKLQRSSVPLTLLIRSSMIKAQEYYTAGRK